MPHTAKKRRQREPISISVTAKTWEFAFLDVTVIEPAHREYAYRYELGREVSQRGESPGWLGYLKTLPEIGSEFPATPWLRISETRRRECVRAIVDGAGPNKVRHAWLWSLSSRQPPSFWVEYPPKSEEDFEAATDWQDQEMCEPCKELMHDIRKWQNNCEKDFSMPYIGGYIDLSLPDQVIVSGFQNRLVEARKKAGDTIR